VLRSEIEVKNKAQFIAALAPHFNDSKKDAAHAVDIVFDTITRTMARGEDVMINDFGKFKKVDRKARMGRNPFTGETIKIKASKKARFLPAKALKEIVAGDRKLGPAPKPEVKPSDLLRLLDAKSGAIATTDV